jgi:hypothetical protein
MTFFMVGNVPNMAPISRDFTKPGADNEVTFFACKIDADVRFQISRNHKFSVKVP